MPQPTEIEAIFSRGKGVMLKWDARDSLPQQAIAIASAKNTVVHVDFASSDNSAQKRKIRLAVSLSAKPAFHVCDNDEFDQIVNKLREEMSKLL
jgi:hypothetical protein